MKAHALAVFGLSAALAATLSAQSVVPPPAPVQPLNRPLRIISFGAHPDDCELDAAGIAAKYAALGHKFKCVAVTNGDIGHWQSAGGPLALRRLAEVKKADAIIGATTHVLDIHDGELMPTLENRLTFIRIIREWKADIVIAHRPWDYHPDHRYTGGCSPGTASRQRIRAADTSTPTPVELLDHAFDDQFARRGDVGTALGAVVGARLVEHVDRQRERGFVQHSQRAHRHACLQPSLLHLRRGNALAQHGRAFHHEGAEHAAREEAARDVHHDGDLAERLHVVEGAGDRQRCPVVGLSSERP